MLHEGSQAHEQMSRRTMIPTSHVFFPTSGMRETYQSSEMNAPILTAINSRREEPASSSWSQQTVCKARKVLTIAPR